MASVSENVYINQLDDIVNKYNNTYHSTIKTKPVDVKSSTYIDSSKEINDKDPELKIGDIVIISKCKNIFPKDYVPNWTQDVFVIDMFQIGVKTFLRFKKLKTLCRVYMLLMILMEKEMLECLMKKIAKKDKNQNQKRV